jgi:hypothetical protein
MAGLNITSMRHGVARVSAELSTPWLVTASPGLGASSLGRESDWGGGDGELGGG